jgi:hypothetical protein
MTSARPRDHAVLGRQVRTALWKFASLTRTRGTARDQTAIATIRSRFPSSRDVFSDAMLSAVLREPQAGLCTWDALKVLTAAAAEQMPEAPTPALIALLGKPCARCWSDFDTGRVARRERAMLAAAAQHSPTAATGYLWPSGSEPVGLVAAARAAARRNDPPYYRPGRPR